VVGRPVAVQAETPGFLAERSVLLVNEELVPTKSIPVVVGFWAAKRPFTFVMIGASVFFTGVAESSPPQE